MANLMDYTLWYLPFKISSFIIIKCFSSLSQVVADILSEWLQSITSHLCNPLAAMVSGHMTCLIRGLLEPSTWELLEGIPPLERGVARSQW